MRQRSNVDNLYNLDTGTVHGTNCRLTTVTGTLHVSLHLAQTQVIGNLCAILSSHLSSIGSVLLRTTETHLTCRRPRDNLTFAISQRHNNVIERAVHVELAECIYSYISLL